MISYNDYKKLAVVLTDEFHALGILDNKYNAQNGQTKPPAWGGEWGRRTYQDLPTVYYYLKGPAVARNFKKHFVEHFNVVNWESTQMTPANINLCLSIANKKHPIFDKATREKAYKNMKEGVRETLLNDVNHLLTALEAKKSVIKDIYTDILEELKLFQAKLRTTDSIPAMLQAHKKIMFVGNFCLSDPQEARNAVEEVRALREVRLAPPVQSPLSVVQFPHSTGGGYSPGFHNPPKKHPDKGNCYPSEVRGDDRPKTP